MSTSADRGKINGIPPIAWVVVVIGLCAAYGPTYYLLATTVWQTDEQFHGAMVACVVGWLLWDGHRHVLSAAPAPRPVAGFTLLLAGLAMYVLGRSQDILMFEVASQIPVLLGALLVLSGTLAVRPIWFALAYIIFMIPLPAVLIDTLTGPLKHWISLIAEELLHAAGYPIGRSGVTLTVGQYQLLVADACSGLHSMASLMAMGILFMYVMARRSAAHNLIVFASILPVAFAANIVRVLALVLVTYHLGDEAGQGFLHGAAGIVLFVIGLLLLAGIDRLLAQLIPERAKGVRP